MKRALLIVVALLLFAIAFVALFPRTAVDLLASNYTVGLSMDAKGHAIFLGVGLTAALLATWSLVKAVRS